jgi:hypothetical protein
MGMMGSLPPQVLQQLMQAIATQGGQGGGQAPPQGVPPGGGQPSQMPSLQTPGQQPQTPQFQTGRSTMMLPGGTASPSVPGVPQSATPPRQSGNMRASGVAAIPGAVMMVKQKMQQDKVQKARQLASQYIALKQSDDPNVQKTADAMMMDPKVHKVFDKAVSDPNSAEYQGVQMAYRDQMTQEQQKVAMEEMRARVQQQQAMTQAEQQRAAQEQAHAGLYRRQEELEGQVTPAKRAEIDQKDRAQLEASKRIQMQVDQRVKTTKMTTDAMLKATEMRVAAMKAALGAHTGDKVLDAVAKEYTNLNAQIKVLNDQTAKLQADLSAHPVANWFHKDAAAKRAQIESNMAQAQMLQKQLQMVEQKRQMMMQVGALPPDVGNVGTMQEPIVVSPEDMQ